MSNSQQTKDTHLQPERSQKQKPGDVKQFENDFKTSQQQAKKQQIQEHSQKQDNTKSQNLKEQAPQPNYQKVMSQLKKMNQTVLYDISVKKGRRDKFTNHMNKIQALQKDFETNPQNFNQDQKAQIYEKISIIYYNLARLGQNQTALETAILLLELSQCNRYLVVRWRMQLAAMKSSSSHKGAYKVAVQTMVKITKIIEEMANNLSESKPRLSNFLKLVLKVINSQRKNDFIWIHNFQNNIKCFTDHIRQLMISSQNQSMHSNEEGIVNSSNSMKIQPFYSGYDFQIADYMSLQKLEIDFIQKYNEVSNIKQIAKQIVIFASICCFTQATETYYLNNYSLKYLHFKAIEIALLAVDRECTYIGFLLKVLNDYYGTKMSQIRQENSELMQINQLKRRMPRDKREVSMKNLCFAEQ